MPSLPRRPFHRVDPAPLSSAIGEFWPLAQVAVRLGATEDALRDAIAEDRVLHITTADDERIFPAFQFADGRVMPGLRPVLQIVMPASDGWAVTQWLQTPLRALSGKTPFEVAREGSERSQRKLLKIAEAQAAQWRSDSSSL